MSNNPIVSVILPFFNAEKYIGEAIASVLAQTYDSWELLLVDDGSTDGSTRLAQQCAADHPSKARYLQHENHRNRGACAARNLGVARARGEYIALLDADDVWLPHKLERQLAILASRPEIAMVYGPSQYWFGWTGNPEDIQRDYVRSLGVQPDTLIGPPTLLTLSLQSQAPTPCPSNILLRRQTVESVGGFEEQFRGIYQLYEDQAFLAKIYLSYQVFVSSECWDKYRQHPESCVSVARSKKYSVGLFYLTWLEDYLSSRGIENNELWSALRQKRRRYRYPNLYRWLKNPRWYPMAVMQGLGAAARQVIAIPVVRWLRSR